MRTLAWISKQPGKRDIYVCMSSQQKAEEKTSKKGNKYLAPIRGQQNVVALKSLYLDIDFKGGDHGYDTPDDAVKALSAVHQGSGPPAAEHDREVRRRPPRLFHPHARAHTRTNGNRWPHALAEAGKRHGLKADYQVTIDSARAPAYPGNGK